MGMRSTLAKDQVLPLENGDTLTREEFHRRYEASPDIKKAELIDGIVYLASPVSIHHSKPHARLTGWLVAYAARHDGTEVHDNPTLVLSGANEPQPDLVLRRLSGASMVNNNDYLEGGPELVVEIAATSASLDLNAKLRTYERAGIPEYLVWRTLEDVVEWFALENGSYKPLKPGSDGILESRQFPGLRLSVDVLLDGSLRDLLALVR
jgi:Uma2 family endonuclease